MARYYIDESIIVKGECLDKGFILDTDTGKVEWTEPIRNGETRVFDVNECIYNDGNDTPVSIEDGELVGKRIFDKKDIINAIIASQNQQSDLPLEFDWLLDFIATYPNSETANSFAEWHLENYAEEVAHDGSPAFTYLIGRNFNLTDWVADEDQEAFRKTHMSCKNCRYYGDEVPGHCGVGNEKPEPCDPDNTCSQFTPW
ncbi:MAG: hypothetical protein ACOY9Y_06640 [Bacillota bacterium]